MIDPSKPLFILEIANNHMGCLEHGIRIIREVEAEIAGYRDRFQFGFQLQYRDLGTFIHPSAPESSEYVKRHRDSMLEPQEFLALREEIRKLELLAVCAPSDEQSVDLLELHDFDIVKIASYSLTDWPLLMRIARVNRPIIASTGGARLDEIAAVVERLSTSGSELALMHSIAEFPTPVEKLRLGQIKLLARSFPKHRVGFSTHEPADETLPVQLALAAGAQIFEKHVGIETWEWPLNAYSANPAQVRAWVEAADEAIGAYGSDDRRSEVSSHELGSLQALRRAVFATQPIRFGQVLESDNVSLATPPIEGQLLANDLAENVRHTVLRPVSPGEPIMRSDVVRMEVVADANRIAEMVVRFTLVRGVTLPREFEIELSHHFGLEQYDRFGVATITVSNRGRCKKILSVLPGQTHPEEFHLSKEETLKVVSGSIDLYLDGAKNHLSAGDVVTIPHVVKHWFHSKEGAVIEETSSNYDSSDSYYTDLSIQRNEHRITKCAFSEGSCSPVKTSQEVAA